MRETQSDKSSIVSCTASVRLACLMCAASVYPEPGSNSLVYGIYIINYINRFEFELYKLELKFTLVVSKLPLGFFS